MDYIWARFEEIVVEQNFEFYQGFFNLMNYLYDGGRRSAKSRDRSSRLTVTHYGCASYLRGYPIPEIHIANIILKDKLFQECVFHGIDHALNETETTLNQHRNPFEVHLHAHVVDHLRPTPDHLLESDLTLIRRPNIAKGDLLNFIDSFKSHPRTVIVSLYRQDLMVIDAYGDSLKSQMTGYMDAAGLPYECQIVLPHTTVPVSIDQDGYAINNDDVFFLLEPTNSV
jgi:hypothetical protein